jgi:sacsin
MLTYNRDSILQWVNISACKTTIVVDEELPVPEIDGVQFVLSARLQPTYKILEVLKLAECLSFAEVIQRYTIAAWKSERAINWPIGFKKQAAELILRQYANLSLSSRSELRTLPMVPASSVGNNSISRFAVAADLIDPTVPELRGLFFEEEEVLPVSQFFANFDLSLKDCGLKTRLDEDLVANRVRYYANSCHPISEVQCRAHRLLRSYCIWKSRSSIRGYPELRQLKWLPVPDPNGALVLRAPDECRGSRDQFLVSSRLPICDLHVSSDWEDRLGWNDILSDEILLAQLEHGILQKDRAIVDAVLAYIYKNGKAKGLADRLLGLSCVLTSNNLLVTPCKAFNPAGPSLERTHPYLGNVENKFWLDHSELLIILGVRGEPAKEDLFDVQRILELKAPLTDPDIAVAIEILNLASKMSRDSLDGLKVLDTTGNFCLIQEINYHDIGRLDIKEPVNLTHPDIPLRTIKSLEIEFLHDRLSRNMLEIADIEDEDEFYQREEVTTRIKDTLSRYSVTATFSEYLANADDAGATRIDWLLDEKYYAKERVLTVGLKGFQGPGLLVYNDRGK